MNSDRAGAPFDEENQGPTFLSPTKSLRTSPSRAGQGTPFSSPHATSATHSPVTPAAVFLSACLRSVQTSEKAPPSSPFRSHDTEATVDQLEEEREVSPAPTHDQSRSPYNAKRQGQSEQSSDLGDLPYTQLFSQKDEADRSIAEQGSIGSKKWMMTTDELEAVQVSAGQEQLKQMLKKTREAYERNKGVSFQAKKSTKPLTFPSSPTLHTSNRHGEKEYAEQGLRSSPKPLPTWEHAAQKKTEQEPFQVADKLTAARKIEMESESTDNLPFAEAMRRLVDRTPKRYHMKRAEDAALHGKFEPKLTQPVAPKLATEQRQRQGTVYPTREELEEAEYQEALKNRFRAIKLDRRVLESAGDLGVPKVTRRETTKPQEFHLSTDDRSASRGKDGYESQDDVELRKQFRARPLPDFRNTESSRVGRSMEPKPLTQPKAPALKAASRSRSTSTDLHKSQDDIELQKQFRALPMPVTSLHAVQRPMQAPAPKLTEPKPFNLQTERRGDAYQDALRAKLEREKEEERRASEFKAQHMPLFQERKAELPVHTPDLTEVKPFNLEGVRRHEQALREREEKLEHDRIEAREKAQVKARALPATTYRPVFEIQTSSRELVSPQEVQLHSDRRAKERALFEKENQERLALAEEIRRQNEQTQKMIEEMEIKNLRRKPVEEGGLVFKARPVPDLSEPPLTLTSDRDLTLPKTPNFQTKLRPRARNDL